MSKKVFYRYNPHTLTYDRVYPSTRQKLLVLMRHLLVGIIIGIGVFYLINYFFDSPFERQLKQDYDRLYTQYQLLSRQVDEGLVVLDRIQKRDDNLYRALLQAEPLPLSLRTSGIGGSGRYRELQNMPNSDLIIQTTKKIDLLRRQLYLQSNSFDEVLDLTRNHAERLKCIPAIQPISNKDLKQTASGYGIRIDPIYRTPKFHSGMDFTAATGTPVYATGDGVVTQIGWETGYGNTVVIDHGFGYKTLYAHLHKINTKRGKRVTRGEQIGQVGSTGRSTGSHLHYEVLLRDKPVNPINYYFLDLTPDEYDRILQIAASATQMMD